MINITVKKDNERVAVVRFFGWGIFDRFVKARLTEAEKLAEYQGRAFISEGNGFEVVWGTLSPEVVDRIWTEIQDAPVTGRVAGYEWIIQFEAIAPTPRRRMRRRR